MKRNRTDVSVLIKSTRYIWNVYSRCVDNIESVFLQSSVMKMLRGSAVILSACIEGSLLARISRRSNGCVYYDSALLGAVKRSFCGAESLIGPYYEGSGFRRIADGIDALLVRADIFLSGARWNAFKDNSKIIGILRRCSGKR